MASRHFFYNARFRAGLLFILSFAIIGIVFLVASRASTPTASFEAEAGASGNTTVLSDITASGGHVIRFDVAQQACSGTAITAGSDEIANGTNLKNAVSSAPAGTTFCIGRGTYRFVLDSNANGTIAALPLKSGDTLWGASGAIISGAKQVTSWSQSGSAWVASGYLPSANYTDSYNNPNGCEDTAANPCTAAEGMFRDKTHLKRVMSQAAVTTGTFYNDYANNKIYVGDNPNGHNEELSYTRHAVNTSGVNNVTIRGLTVEMFAVYAQHGAIEQQSPMSGWLIEDNDIRFNHGAGLKLYTTNAAVRDNYIHDNGQEGIAVYKSTGVTIEGNELSGNNNDGFMVNDGDNGGIKVAFSAWPAGSTWSSSQPSVIFRNNYVHDNNALGVWFDIDNAGADIYGNYIANNASDGIRYEISSNARIHDNKIVSNGFNRGRQPDPGLANGGGIAINTSFNVNVYNNQIWQNNNAVAFIVSGGRITGARDFKNNIVHDNSITMQQGRSGLSFVQESNAAYADASHILYCHNTYHTSLATPFYWKNVNQAFSDFQAAGQEKSGVTCPLENGSSENGLGTIDSSIPVRPTR